MLTHLIALCTGAFISLCAIPCGVASGRAYARKDDRNTGFWALSAITCSLCGTAIAFFAGAGL